MFLLCSSWLLLQLFLSLDVGLIEDSEKTKLCTSFSNQLESLGEWEWAIFVLLHLEDNYVKRNLVTAVLDRNLPPDSSKKTLDAQDNLVNRMRVPPEWIHGVKANKFLSLGQHFQAYNHFAHAQDYNGANDVFLEHILPRLFINEQYDIIKTLIREIEPGSEEILDWETGAGLILDFIEMQEDVVTYKPAHRQKLYAKLRSLGDRMTSFSVCSDEQNLCVAEMSKRCATVYKEVLGKSRSDLFGYYSDFVGELVMPPDYKQHEALYLINEPDGGLYDS